MTVRHESIVSAWISLLGEASLFTMINVAGRLANDAAGQVCRFKNVEAFGAFPKS